MTEGASTVEPPLGAFESDLNMELPTPQPTAEELGTLISDRGHEYELRALMPWTVLPALATFTVQNLFNKKPLPRGPSGLTGLGLTCLLGAGCFGLRYITADQLYYNSQTRKHHYRFTPYWPAPQYYKEIGEGCRSTIIVWKDGMTPSIVTGLGNGCEEFKKMLKSPEECKKYEGTEV